MATIDDKATEAEEKFRDEALKQRMNEFPATGQCYWCADPTQGVFCCKECREYFEQRERFKR